MSYKKKKKKSWLKSKLKFGKSHRQDDLLGAQDVAGEMNTHYAVPDGSSLMTDPKDRKSKKL